MITILENNFIRKEIHSKELLTSNEDAYNMMSCGDSNIIPISHRVDGPAVICYSKNDGCLEKTTELWYLNGKPSREGGPSTLHIKDSEYKERWRLNGDSHMDTGPSDFCYSKSNIHFSFNKNGKACQATDPRIPSFFTINFDNTARYLEYKFYKNNSLHRKGNIARYYVSYSIFHETLEETFLFNLTNCDLRGENKNVKNPLKILPFKITASYSEKTSINSLVFFFDSYAKKMGFPSYLKLEKYNEDNNYKIINEHFSVKKEDLHKIVESKYPEKMKEIYLFNINKDNFFDIFGFEHLLVEYSNTRSKAYEDIQASFKFIASHNKADFQHSPGGSCNKL